MGPGPTPMEALIPIHTIQSHCDTQFWQHLSHVMYNVL